MEESLRDLLDDDDYKLFKRYEKDCAEGREGFYDADEYSVIAEALILSQEYERAQALLKEASKRYPSSVELGLKKAELYMEMGFDDKAMHILDQVEQVEPYLYDVHLLKAHLLKDAARYEEAMQSVKKAEAAGADPLDLDFCLAGIYARLKQKEKAWAHAKMLLGNEDDSIQAANDFFSLCVEIGCLDEAIAYVREVAKQNPFHVMYWKLLSELAEEKHDYKEAIEAAEYAIAAAPDDKEAWMKKLALLEAVQDSDQNPLNFYIEALAKIDDPGVKAAIECRIAQEYELSGEYDKAEGCYKKALSHPDTHRYSLFRMGVIAHYRMDLDKAMDYFNQALAYEDPTDRERENTGLIYRGMARNCYYRGNADGLLHYSFLAYEVDPGSSQHLYSLALDACRLEAAPAALAHIKGLDPENDSRLLLVRAALEAACGHETEAYQGFAQAFLDEELREDADSRFYPFYEADPEILALRNTFEPVYKEDMTRLQEERAFEEYYGPLPDRYGTDLSASSRNSA